MKKKGLGKGLEALFEDNTSAIEGGGAETVKISEITPNKEQPRKDFDQAALEQLADSIREHGVIQPLILRPVSTGGYQIVAGERRYRASRMAGLTEVPAVIRELSDIETMEIALIENLQREDLNPIEEALGYRELMDEYHLTQDEVAKRVGKSRPVIANALRLLNLPDEAIDEVRAGHVSAGHARALLAMDAEDAILAILKRILHEGLSVREVEKLTAKAKEETPRSRKSSRNSMYDEVEIALMGELGRKVTVVPGRKKGTLSIEFYGLEDLQQLAQKVLGIME